MRKVIRKFADGVRRYGLWRALTGMTTFLKFEILKPRKGVISTVTDRLIINFKFPSQFMPTLVIFKELIEPEFEFLRYILDKDSVFFDVGGGIGAYSIFAAKLVNGPLQIFEPLQENIQTIRENLEANLVESNVQLNAMALSDKDGFGIMQKGERLFLSHLNDVSADYQPESVKVTSLDSFCSQRNIDHIDILKIDVEGHESEVLEGTKELLNKRKVSIIILEANPALHSFYNSLEEMGFDFFYYDYDDNSLREILPVSGKNIRDSKPSYFHSNIILVQREIVEKIRDKLNCVKQ